MTYTGDELTKNTLFDATAAAREAAGSAVVTDPDAMARSGQLLEVLAYIDLLRGVPAWLFGPDARGALGELETHVRSAEVHLAAAGPDDGDGGVALGANLPGILDNFAACLRRVPQPPVDAAGATALSEAAEHYRSAATRAVETLNEKIDAGATAAEAVDTQLADLATEIEASKTTVDAQIVRLVTALDQNEATFEERATTWKTDADQHVTDFDDETKKQLEASARISEAAEAELRGSAQATLDALAIMEKDGRGLVEAAARKTISDSYAGYAFRQGVLATVWAALTIGLAIWGFVVLTHALAKTNDVHTAEAIMKGLASLTILGIAAYSGRESAGHRREARDAKRVQLDLNALEPAITRMEEGEQATLRSDVLKSVFLRTTRTPEKNDSASVNLSLSGSDVLSLITRAGSNGHGS